MAIDPVSAVLGIASIGSSIFGGSQQNSAANKQIAAQNKYNQQMYRFNNREGRLNANWARKDAQIQFNNLVNTYKWQDEADQKAFEYERQRLTFDYNNQMKQFAKSEENFKRQVQFNNIAAAQAYQAEQNVRNEFAIAQAFESESLLLESIAEEGVQLAKGQSGRSASKGLKSIMAAAGRNAARSQESAKSADRQMMMNLRKIDMEKLGADLQAEAARMIKPEMPPMMPKPQPRPLPELHLPRKYRKPPAPIPGAMASNSGVWMGAASSALSSLASMNWSGISASRSGGNTSQGWQQYAPKGT